MGFPRIISKNNKIYTKLGDFCLSGDGQQFWIVCHTCQEELQTQDKFWKHIQDEHNFMHGIKQEQTRTAAQAYMEAAEAASAMMPLPLYRKISVNDTQREEVVTTEDEDMQKEPKDYTEMRAHEEEQQQQQQQATVAIDIKLEPSSLSQSAIQQAHQQQQQQQQEQIQQQQQQQQTQQIEITAPLMYQIPQVHPPVSAYAALVQAPGISTLNMSVAAAAAAASSQVPSAMAALLPQELQYKQEIQYKQELQHKESTNNSTTASASSAVSSDDGERWYICDFENCGLKFKYQSRLELHRCVHSKERRFACEICGASFKQSCNLSTHRKKKHALKGTTKVTLVPPQRF